MNKACMISIILSTVIYSAFAYADDQNTSDDAYSQCVIRPLKSGS